LEAIREDLATSKFHSEGYKKVHHRVRRKHGKVAKTRLLAIMKENKLLSPVRPKWNGSSRPKDGTITTLHPNQMWGTDRKQFYTAEEGLCWFFFRDRPLKRRDPLVACDEGGRSFRGPGAGPPCLREVTHRQASGGAGVRIGQTRSGKGHRAVR